jgi:uncharacterized protein YoxC
MATKKKGGGEVLDLSTRILIEIRDEIRGTNERVDSLSRRVDGLTSRVDGLTTRVDTLTTRLDAFSNTVETGFAKVNARLDNFLELVGDRYRDLDARVRALEARAH